MRIWPESSPSPLTWYLPAPPQVVSSQIMDLWFGGGTLSNWCLCVGEGRCKGNCFSFLGYYRRMLLLLLFFKVGLGFELRALQSRCSTAWTTPSVHFPLVNLKTDVSQTLCSGWPQTAILLISASQVARIIDVSHRCPAQFWVLKILHWSIIYHQP
jgi:hypothetical protein